jgi:hypothetical protein
VRRFITLASSLGVGFGLLACGRPPLRISVQERCVVVDMQTLGEYPSDLARLRLTDASTKRVLWEVRGREEPQVGRVELYVGENPVQLGDVRHGVYDVIAPTNRSTFTLQPTTRYIIEVWGNDTKPRSKRQAEFVTRRS